MKLLMKLSCKLADKTLAISQNTKNDLISILDVNPNKVEVMYLGVEERFKKNEDKKSLEETINKFKIQLPFIFYCSSLSPRKNMLRVFKAFNNIKDKIPHNFYIVSGQSWHDKEVLEYVSKNLSDRVFILGKIEEKDLINLYSLADLFTFPSLYEGFGLPILEAQACGLPVITSNKTSCYEIAKDSAKIVDPYNTNEIGGSILEVLQDNSLRERLILAGLENIKNYSWQKSVDVIFKNI